MTTVQRLMNGVPPALQVSELTVAYGGFLAISDVALRVTKGSMVALIGPNGAGKTTCFNAIGGFIRPKRGSAFVDGVAVKLGDPLSLWAAGVGRTFQRLELFWTLSVREHLELAYHRAHRRGAQPPAVDDVIDLVGLGRVEAVGVAALPLGTCRLVELARALSTGARLLMLDEPSSGLDREETAGFEATVRRVNEERGTSILLVEHDMELVTSLADHVYVLDFGQVIAEGTPQEIQQSAIVQSVYLGADPAEEEAANETAPRRRAPQRSRKSSSRSPRSRNPA